MAWVHRTIVVPAAFVEPARVACAALAGAGGDGMFTAALSPTASEPPTHYASTGLIEDAFAELLSDPAALESVAAGAGLDPAGLLAVLAASDVSDEPHDVAFARLGLQQIHSTTTTEGI